MAEPVYKSADAARAAAMSSRPTAFAQMSSVQPSGNLGAGNVWANAASNQDPFYIYASTTDPMRKSEAFQNLNRSLSNTLDDNAKSAGFKNNYEYLTSLIAKSGLAKDPLKMGSALDKVISTSIALNTDPFSFLEGYTSSLKGQGTAPKKLDTTTQYSKQIQTALQFKDLGDARQYYSDSYFATWGSFPTAELDKKFQDAWNTAVKEQDAPTTTTTKSEKAPIYDKKSKPVIDPTTKKQKVDKFGNPVYSKIALDANGQKRYTSVVTSSTTSKGEGFTKEEQDALLADFLVANNPDTKWNVENLGGAAKTLYDGITAFHRANYTTPPDLATVTPLIKNVLSSADSKVANEFLTQYKNGVRKQTASKYMSIAEYVNAGEDADKYVKPMLENLSNLLETNITVDDPFAASIFNFKDDKGNYRMPNAHELNNLVMNHPKFPTTSRAINEAVDLTQSLRSKLGRS